MTTAPVRPPRPSPPRRTTPGPRPTRPHPRPPRPPTRRGPRSRPHRRRVTGSCGGAHSRWLSRPRPCHRHGIRMPYGVSRSSPRP
ncbi:hypothetical protein CP970_30045 [Streptomyces kanamyceticus]|uniref:Uncharacterized protein n=1 Tax=Streptomyces kanamyceticus TaxID=1967 RepID=A0A5J6GKF9_STRKN|nr:hypothetical protein CP970_30045 [Streptomyces kanamyceticus]